MSSKRGTKNTARKSTTRNGPPKEDKVSYEEESDGTLCMIVENGETRKRSKLGELSEEPGDETSDAAKEGNGEKSETNGDSKTPAATTAGDNKEKAKAEASGAGESADSEPDSVDSEEEKSSKEKLEKEKREIKNDLSDPGED